MRLPRRRPRHHGRLLTCAGMMDGTESGAAAAGGALRRVTDPAPGERGAGLTPRIRRIAPGTGADERAAAVPRGVCPPDLLIDCSRDWFRSREDPFTPPRDRLRP